MELSALDWAVMGLFLLLIVGLGLSYNKESGSDLNSYFLGGRNMPWFLAGLSMVATTFAADTPLAVAEIVGAKGIAGNWVWWSFLAGGMLTTFFFANLWQRSGVLTESEFTELRYSGQGAKWLRVFKSVYLGLLMNIIVIGWVNVALMKILSTFFGLGYWDGYFYTAAIMVLTAIYSTFSGFKGVVVTDAVQFCIAMGGCIVLAVLVVNSEQIGGLSELKTELIAAKGEQFLGFFPSMQSNGSLFSLSIVGFFAYVGIQWWASWYPGAEPGGGGYVVQRILSTKSPKEAVWATLLFQFLHYCVRPWAWIMVGLAAVLLYAGELHSPSDYYVLVMKDFLPSGLRGLLLVAFFAAYMSTISTQLNWGASCLINDVQKRLHKSPKADSYYVWSAKLCTVFLAILGILATLGMDSVASAWGFLMQCGAGVGGVLIMRWYWRRVNVWSEVTAMIMPFVITAFCYYTELDQYEKLILTALITTVAWVLVSLLTPSTDAATLNRFWALVHRRKITLETANTGILDHSETHTEASNLGFNLVGWLSALVLAYSLLFLVGKVLLLEWAEAGICAGLCVVSLLSLRWAMSKIHF